MTSEEASALRDQAVALRDALNRDITSAMTRNDHIRLTARANEAANLVYAIELSMLTPATPTA